MPYVLGTGLRRRWRVNPPATKIAAMVEDRAPAGATPRTGSNAGDEDCGGSFASRVLRELSTVDHAVYLAVASTPTPALDVPLRRLSNAANRSLIWVMLAILLAGVGGRRGRRAAAAGLASVAVSSATVNLGLKRLAARDRPDRAAAGVADARHTRMPVSSSFPSGHSASGFAFATAVGHQIPVLSFPLRMLAAAVAYSRVHSGVHYPGDTIIGALAGGALGLVVGTRLSGHASAHP
jgi:undecaprenyl-diphosphatase